jgi:hypothetical protein
VIVHEAWHFRYGRLETGAYGAQIMFLLENHAPGRQIAAVQTARDRVAASTRRLDEAVKRTRDEPPGGRDRDR